MSVFGGVLEAKQIYGGGVFSALMLMLIESWISSPSGNCSLWHRLKSSPCGSFEHKVNDARHIIASIFNNINQLGLEMLKLINKDWCRDKNPGCNRMDNKYKNIFNYDIKIFCIRLQCVSQFRVLELNVSEHQRRSCQYNAINSAFYRRPPPSLGSLLHPHAPPHPRPPWHPIPCYEELKHWAWPVRLHT